MKFPKIHPKALRRVLLFFGFSAALWALYYFLIYVLYFQAAIWVYFGLFAVAAVFYIFFTRGTLGTPPPETPPPGVLPDEYDCLRALILRRQKQTAWIPLFCGAVLFVILLDLADLFLLNGLLTR